MAANFEFIVILILAAPDPQGRGVLLVFFTKLKHVHSTLLIHIISQIFAWWKVFSIFLYWPNNDLLHVIVQPNTRQNLWLGLHPFRSVLVMFEEFKSIKFLFCPIIVTVGLFSKISISRGFSLRFAKISNPLLTPKSDQTCWVHSPDGDPKVWLEKITPSWPKDIRHGSH